MNLNPNTEQIKKYEFKPGQSGNPSGRPKAVQDWIEKEQIPSLEKIKEKRDFAKDERLQFDAAKEIVRQGSGQGEADTKEVKIVIGVEKTYEADNKTD